VKVKAVAVKAVKAVTRMRIKIVNTAINALDVVEKVILSQNAMHQRI
jgi:hypothetical protein